MTAFWILLEIIRTTQSETGPNSLEMKAKLFYTQFKTLTTESNVDNDYTRSQNNRCGRGSYSCKILACICIEGSIYFNSMSNNRSRSLLQNACYRSDDTFHDHGLLIIYDQLFFRKDKENIKIRDMSRYFGKISILFPHNYYFGHDCVRWTSKQSNETKTIRARRNEIDLIYQIFIANIILYPRIRSHHLFTTRKWWIGDFVHANVAHHTHKHIRASTQCPVNFQLILLRQIRRVPSSYCWFAVQLTGICANDFFTVTLLISLNHLSKSII